MSAVKVKLLCCFLLCSFLAAFGQSFGSKPLFIEDIKITGTRTLDSTRLNEIIGPLNQKKVRSKEEIEQRLRGQFQDAGYYDLSIERFEVKAIDPLETPVRVHVEAEVTEGVRYRVGTIEFQNIKALTADELRAGFPVRTGDFFSRTKIGTGLEALRKAYAKLGYIDIYAVPMVTPSDGRVNFVMDVNEGQQYRMGNVEFAGDAELADKIRPNWALENGKPFDASYLDQFFKQSESLLPSQFDSNRSVKIARNCKENTVSVFVELGPNHPNIKPPEDLGCEGR